MHDTPSSAAGRLPGDKGPLHGVVVVDLTSVVMGPFATQILASLGAEVIKVESPNGDDMRRVGPMRHENMGHIFLHANAGKRSVVLDLKQPEGHEALLRLLQRADVLVSNIRPQALRRLRLDYDSLAEAFPRLIHVNCCGFDQRGPYAQRPAYDDLIQGATGVSWLMQAYGGGAPTYMPTTLADRVTGLHAVYAVTAALYARERSGRGQAVEVTMYEAMSQFILGDHMAGLSFEPPLGEPGYARLLTPHRHPYQTSDGYLCVLIYNDKHWRRFFEAIGEPERVSDPRFGTHAGRARHIDAVYAEVARLMRLRTTAQWRELLDAVDIPNMPMASPADLLTDAQHQATGFIRKVQHPSEGEMLAMGAPTRWSDTPLPEAPCPAPQLGQDTEAVLAELGYARADIDQLLHSGAAATPASHAAKPEREPT